MVSHCVTDSKREDYVQQLRQYLTVDVYGACGDLACQHNWENPECSKMLGMKFSRISSSKRYIIVLERDYMFYLAFENSICVDYVTEKLFRTLELDVVPVVMGGANYSSLLPPGSYIDTADYASPRSLAEELLRLAANREEYMQYFWWKVARLIRKYSHGA